MNVKTVMKYAMQNSWHHEKSKGDELWYSIDCYIDPIATGPLRLYNKAAQMFFYNNYAGSLLVAHINILW